MAWKIQEGTKHSFNCERVFKNYDLKCPRCIELKNGGIARKGWGDWKKEHEKRHILAIRNHDCKLSNCNVICTFGEW